MTEPRAGGGGPQRLERRDFLKHAGAVGLLAGGASWAALAPSDWPLSLKDADGERGKPRRRSLRLPEPPRRAGCAGRWQHGEMIVCSSLPSSSQCLHAGSSLSYSQEYGLLEPPKSESCMQSGLTSASASLYSVSLLMQ